MKRAIIILVLAVFYVLNSFSQDIIYKKNGEQILCKVEEIVLDKVKYRRSDNIEGPIYSLLKREILVIVYENGTYEYPNVEVTTTQESEFEKGEEVEKQELNFSRNLIAFNPVNLIHGNVNLSYEHIFSSGKVALRLPIKIGFDNTNEKDYFFPAAVKQKVTGSVELGLMFYPFGQADISYVNGIGVEVGGLNSFKVISNYDQMTGIYSQDTTIEYNTFGSMYFYNGFKVSPNEHFIMSFLVGIGPKKLLDTRRNLEFTMNLSFNLGYSF